MQLLQDKILAQIIEDDVTDTGILLLKGRFKKHKARILAVGPKVKHLRAGDAIQYDHNEAQPYDELEGKDCIFITENKGFIARL